jgi:dTDP-4-amino-4,6-dideoxygalactose transaminase
MDSLLALADRHDLLVLEDVAQAFGGSYDGTKLGTLGAAGAFSFFPSKNLGAYGDGGLIATGDAEIAQTARKLRAHGGKNKYANEMIGYNSRLDELQAAILRVKLRVLPSYNEGRRRVAHRYDEALRGQDDLTVPPVLRGDHVYHQYTVRIHHGRRDRVQELLAGQGIASVVYYPNALHRLPVYADDVQSFPAAEQATGEVLSLPIWPQMDEATQDRVCHSLLEALDD